MMRSAVLLPPSCDAAELATMSNGIVAVSAPEASATARSNPATFWNRLTTRRTNSGRSQNVTVRTNRRRPVRGCSSAMAISHARARAASPRLGASDPEDLGLLRRELLLGEDALVLELGELLELLDGIRLRLGRRRRVDLLRLRLGVGLLLRPAVGLPARDAVADRGGGSGDGCGAGDAAKQSGHGL